MDEAYVYPGTQTLINKQGICDAGQLEKFERRVFVVRLETLPKQIQLTANGYRQIHRHLFPDVYEWAGKDRTVDTSKSGSYFCRAIYVGPELEKRFEAIQGENGLQGLRADRFADRAAEHVAEVNAIHPFREGNGRTLRAFLGILADHAGHAMDMTRIAPKAWNDASRESFRSGDRRFMLEVISGAMA
jgi:cell filamentation protein